jgi:hypothetical protein
MVDTTAVERIVPSRFGYRSSGDTAFMVCVLVCLVTFLVSPVGNRSRYAPIRGVGRIPVLARYVIFAAIFHITTFLDMRSVTRFTTANLGSVRISEATPGDALYRIHQKLGQQATWVGRGGELRFFFRKEDREAVVKTLQEEHIAVED